MIELQFPRVVEDRYLFFQNVCFGPFDPSGIYSGEHVAFNSTLRSLEQSRGIYGENSVEHQSLTGKFEYCPMVNGITPAPTTQWPKKVTVPVWNYLHSATTVSSNAGLATDGGVSLGYMDASRSICYQYAFSRDPLTGKWSMWIVQSYASVTRPDNITRYDFTTITSTSGDLCTVKSRKRFWSVTQPGFPLTKIDWRVQQTYSVITSCMGSTNPYSDASSSLGGSWYKARIPSYSTSPSDMKKQIDALIGIIFPEKEFPVEDYPYGDLAMRALNQVDSNHTNMIEFVRDLRHPTDMIPKLRNMRSLKAWADRYLTIQYGILPTVRDLQTIVKAFRARSPYLDKNGFRTYSAGETRNLTVDSLTYTKIQYIKVALDREDDEFKLLLERLENMGTFPSFENIWDLVPYSFAIDWLVDVGNFLKRIDTNLRLLRLNIRYVTMSRKTIVHGSSTGGSVKTPFIGTIEWTKYQRWVTDHCPGPTLSLTPPSQPFNHWLEAGALLLQRT